MDKKDIGKNNILGRYVDSYLPFYDEYSDYNTNAKSYYDYLARYNKLLEVLSELVNGLLNRDIEVMNSNSIKLNKLGKWIADNDCELADSIIKLYADVKIADHKTVIENYLGEKHILDNNIIEVKDGIYSPDYIPLLKTIEKKINTLNITNIEDIQNTLDSMQGINLKTLLYNKDYKLKFYNGFFSPSNDLVIQVGETQNTIDIHVSTHSTSGKILKNDTDLRDTELSLRPGKDIPLKSKVFSIIFLNEYEHLNSRDIYIDNTTPVLWHIDPVNARATWSAQLTPHNIDNEINYSWRNLSDGYSRQLKSSYTDKLTLSWGSVQSRITFLK